MDSLDWINLQQEGFDEDSLMMGGNAAVYGNVSTSSGMDPIPKSDSHPLFQPWNVINTPLILDPPLESLDCLLSASNSQTDTTSLEDDDGISTIFSDCGSFWNFTTPSKPAPPPKTAVDPPPPKRKRSDSPDFHFTTTKKPKQDKIISTKSSNISFSQQTSSSAASSGDEPDAEAIAQMKEMIYRAAAFRPVNFGAETVDKPKRKNVRISSDPQTVAARQRRERISERIRVLQKLVPGGNKMDTASMLDEAANYLKFLRSQVKALEALGGGGIGSPGNDIPNLGFSPFVNLASFAAAFQRPQFSIQQPNPVHRSLMVQTAE